MRSARDLSSQRHGYSKEPGYLLPCRHTLITVFSQHPSMRGSALFSALVASYRRRAFKLSHLTARRQHTPWGGIGQLPQVHTSVLFLPLAAFLDWFQMPLVNTIANRGREGLSSRLSRLLAMSASHCPRSGCWTRMGVTFNIPSVTPYLVHAATTAREICYEERDPLTLRKHAHRHGSIQA